MIEWFKKTFIPTELNDYKPNALERAALVGMMVLVLISFSVANLQSMIWFSSDWLVSTILPAVVTEATNAARTEEGREPLVRSRVLDKAAAMKAADMAENGYFAHWSPSGVSPWHWFGEAGYLYTHAGENLAVHFTDSAAVVDAWLDSPTHRENIMNSQYTEIGIGTAKGTYEGFDTVFVVQMFGTPAIITSTVVSAAPVADTKEIVSEDNETDAVALAPEEVAGVNSDTTVNLTEDGTVVYESFAATVAEDAEEVISAPSEDAVSPSSMFTRILTSPRLLLQIAYSLIGLFITGVLIASIIIEWRRQHPVQIAYATAMLLFMMVLFQLHLLVSSGVSIA